MPRDKHFDISVGRSFTVEWGYCNSLPACYVYKVIDQDEQVVYIGITNAFAARWTSHRQSSVWARSMVISRVILTGYESRREARMVEARLIDKYQPPCNTKREQKYLRIVRAEGGPAFLMAAELTPTKRR